MRRGSQVSRVDRETEDLLHEGNYGLDDGVNDVPKIEL
jgi:hypothetical protein